MSLPPELEALLDKQAIHDVMMRYCRAVDRFDAELLRSTYWPDAWDDHGLFSGLRDDLIDWVIPFMRDRFTTVIHSIANEYVELDGAAAFAETYFTGFYETVHDGRAHTRISCGRYIDRFEKRGGEWRVARRTVVNDWGRLDPIDGAIDRPIPGGKFPGDPVYVLRDAYRSPRG